MDRKQTPSIATNQPDQSSDSRVARHFRTPIQYPFHNVLINTEDQQNLVNIFRSIYREDHTGETLRTELAESFSVEEFTSRTVHKNGDLNRRMLQAMHNGGFLTGGHASYPNDPLGKRIIRTLWTDDLQEKSITLFDSVKRGEDPDLYSPSF